MTETRILFAPLQGFTECLYRNTFAKVIGGVDDFYAPFIRLENDKSFRNKDLKDIAREKNTTNLVPQILANNADDFLKAAHYISEQGYQQVNLNLGCPYPMVTNRNLGSGLLPFPEAIKTMLEESLKKTDLQISVKMRLGLNQSTEIEKVIPILNDLPIRHIIVHPRIGKQLYKGELNHNQLQKCIDQSHHKIIYNGDIVDLESFKQVSHLFPGINEFMIGRGLLSNPFLAHEIKNQACFPNDKRHMLLKDFHDQLIRQYIETYSGDTQILQKALAFWTYFSNNFISQHKAFKLIKKSKSLQQYSEATAQIFTNYIG